MNKISKIHNVILNLDQKDKPMLNMTIKGLSRKQVTVPMGLNNAERVMVKANVHISNIKKGVKSEIFVNFIHSNNKELLIITNKVAATSDLNIIKKYIKNLNNIDATNLKP